MGLAIVDDVGAILLIALFYILDISLLYLARAFALITFLAAANYAGVRNLFSIFL